MKEILKNEKIMEKIKTTDRTEHIWKISKAGAILALISIITPATGLMESGITFFMWYFGFWFISGGGDTDTGFASDFFASGYDTKYMMIGGVSIVLLVIAMGAMFAASNKAHNERDYKTAAGASLAGGIFAFIGPGAYYFYIKSEFSGFWITFDPSFGVILAIIAGVLGIIGAIAAGYAFSLESKGELGQTTPYKPTPDKMAIDKDPELTNQQEMPVFCKNCGTKLVGEFCQECGQKAEF